MKKSKINILGSFYDLIIKKYDEDEDFEKRSISGYCNSYSKKIVICDMKTYKGWENEPKEVIGAAQKETIRHEIVHAFFNESGLKTSTNTYDESWAANEEMADWFAIQGEKIYKAWQEANALD